MINNEIAASGTVAARAQIAPSLILSRMINTAFSFQFLVRTSQVSVFWLSVLGLQRSHHAAPTFWALPPAGFSIKFENQENDLGREAENLEPFPGAKSKT
jgi:hypothetical protein